MQQPVRKGRLPMIDVGDDAKISYVRAVHYLNDNRTEHSGQPR
jgi:hypothetical protein